MATYTGLVRDVAKQPFYGTPDWQQDRGQPLGHRWVVWFYPIRTTPGWGPERFYTTNDWVASLCQEAGKQLVTVTTRETRFGEEIVTADYKADDRRVTA